MKVFSKQEIHNQAEKIVNCAVRAKRDPTSMVLAPVTFVTAVLNNTPVFMCINERDLVIEGDVASASIELAIERLRTMGMFYIQHGNELVFDRDGEPDRSPPKSDNHTHAE